jgi:hypothetical protein
MKARKKLLGSYLELLFTSPQALPFVPKVKKNQMYEIRSVIVLEIHNG